MPIVDISVVRSRAKARGSHFFDRDTMKFFGSRVERTAYQIGNAIFFISSEQEDHTKPRGWTIQRQDQDGHIRKVGQFQQYKSLNEARSALRSIIKSSTPIRAAHGYHGVIRKPTRFLVGEGKYPERVNITPIKKHHIRKHNNTFHVGDQFGPNKTSNGVSVSHNTKKEHIKSLLLNYGRALKSAYFGKHDKKQMQSKMVKLNKELKRLEKEEQIAQKRYQISQTRYRISKLSGNTTKTKSFAD